MSSLGFAQYIIYWIKWNKTFNFPLMIASQCLLSLLTLFLVKNLGLNNFIENYFVLVLALVMSQRTVDSLMQYCLLTIDRSHFFFSFYFIKGSVLIGIYFIFILYKIEPISAYLFGLVTSNLFVLILEIKRIPKHMNKFEDFSYTRWVDLYSSSLIYSAINTLESSGLAVINDVGSKAAFALASRISSVLGNLNTLYGVELSQKLVKDYDLSLLRRKSLNILVLYSLITITILFLLFFYPRNRSLQI